MNDREGWRALLVGVSKYDDDYFRDVPAAIKSVRSIENILLDPSLCGWPQGSVHVIEDPRTAIEVAQPLRRLALEATGTFLVYFVGHGTLNEIAELCLVLGETDSRNVEFSSLEYQKLRPILRRSAASTKIVILDCCYSGKAIEALSGEGDDIADIAEIGGAYTLTAAEQAAHVPNSDDPDNRTSFTDALVNLITRGVPGSGESLDLSTIYTKLAQQLKIAGLPKPNQRGTNTVEHFEFSRNAAFLSNLPGVRSVAEQLPNDIIGDEMLRKISERTMGKREYLVDCAIALWRMIEPSTGRCEVIKGRYGGGVAVSGKYALGPLDDRIELDFYLEVAHLPPERGVDQSTMDRLVSRIRSCHFGVLITLSYVDEDVYRRVRSDDRPVVIVTGRDMVEALRDHGCSDSAAVDQWLDSLPSVAL